MTTVRYPEIIVQLSGEDGNALAVLGRVRKALRKAKVPATAIDEFIESAMADDYDHLLRICQSWVTVE